MPDLQLRTGSGGPTATTHNRSSGPSVTVVIPTRDRLAFLQEAVGSVMAQDLEDWRLVVVDDDSSDGTAAWLSTLGDRRVQTVRTPDHVERSAARNLGLDQAVGPFVIFLDDDDRLHPRALTRLSVALRRRPDAFVAVGAKVRFDARGHRRRAPHPRWTVTRAAWREVLAGWVAITGQMLFRHDVLKRVGGFDATLAEAEDQELWLRLGLGLATFIPPVVLEQRTHGASRDGPEVAVVEADMRERFARDLRGRQRLEANRLILARQELQLAVTAFGEDDFRLAAGHLLEASRLAPAMLLSPVIGPTVSLAVAKATAGGVLPRGAALELRRGVRSLRALRGRDPTPENPAQLTAEQPA